MLGYTPGTPSYRSVEEEASRNERQQSEADQCEGILQVDNIKS